MTGVALLAAAIGVSLVVFRMRVFFWLNTPPAAYNRVIIQLVSRGRLGRAHELARAMTKPIYPAIVEQVLIAFEDGDPGLSPARTRDALQSVFTEEAETQLAFLQKI